jgi:hypothetical protein
MPLELRGVGERRVRIGVAARVAEERPGQGDAGDRGRRRRAEPAFEGDPVRSAQGERRQRGVRLVLRLPLDGERDRAAHGIGPVDRELVGTLPLPGHARLGVGVDDHLVAEVQREPEAVEPRTEVRRGGRHPDRDAH